MIEMFKATLSNENISSACEQVHEVLVQRKMNAKDIVRLKLSLEEVLLRFQEQLGKDASFEIDFGKILTRQVFKLSVAGPSINPLRLQDEDTEGISSLMQEVMQYTNDIPAWEFSDGKNIISYTIARKETPGWLKLLIAFLLAVVCGFALPVFPLKTEEIFLHDILEPLMNSFRGILSAVAMPMIFLSVISGICNIGDATTFSKIGKKLGLKCFTLLILTLLIFAGLTSIFFNLEYGSALTNTNPVSSVMNIILGIIPDNLLRPFMDGNSLQILFLAFVLGIAIVVIGEPVKSISSMLRKIELIISTFMSFIVKFTPVYVFGSILQIILSRDIAILASLGTFVLAFTLFACLILFAHLIIISFRTKISVGKLWRNSFSTFLIGLTTASSSAAFSDNVESCINKFNISPRLAKFGVPFCQIIYRPTNPILIWMMIVSVADLCKIQVSPSWLITALVLTILFSVATPPVANGMAAIYVVLFKQLGIPTGDILGIVIALDTMLDFIGTAIDLVCGQYFLFDFSVKNGMNESKAA